MTAFIRRIVPAAGVLSVLGLTGCTTVLEFPTSNLPQPRPSAENVKEPSMAMRIAKAIATTQNCIGCADTLLWDDEAHLAKEAGFDPIKTQELILEAKKAREEVAVKTSDTKPEGSGWVTLNSGFVVADSLDGVWNNSPSIGAGLGVGLLLGILTSRGGSTQYVESVNTSPATESFKFGYVFPKDKRIRVEGYQPESGSVVAQHARLYGAKAFVEVAAKTAVDFGFTRVGPIRVHFFRESNRALDWGYIWQPLENDALGCPKVTDETEREDMCRIEWAPYASFTPPFDETWLFQSGIVPDALGGNGKKDAWMAFLGYDDNYFGPLFVDEADNVEDEVKLQRDFVMGLRKHMTAGMYAYVPSYRIDGKDTPQVVIDKDHVYNFAVIVPRKNGKPAPVPK